MDFKGTGKRLSPQDFENAARMVGCDVATIQAVVDVEAAGRGFDKAGRPKILFEPHIFWRHLGKGTARQRAADAGLAYPKWGASPYPKTSEGNYDRLRRAMAIDADAALKAASWGLPQILGENHRDAGYPDVFAMVEAFKAGEGEQLAAMVRCVDTWSIADDLQNKNWRGFARRYNGPGYEKNGYHTKLAAAYKRRSAGKAAKEKDAVPVDVRMPPERPRNAPQPAPRDPGPITDPVVIERVQRRLQELGYFEVGRVDGGGGGLSRTEGAILAFRNDNGLPLRPTIDDELLAALEKAQPRHIPDTRANAEPKDIAKENTTVRATMRNRIAGWWATVTGGVAAAIAAIKEQFQDVWYALEPVRDIASSVPTWLWFAIAAAGCWIIYRNAREAEADTVEAYRKGKIL